MGKLKNILMVSFFFPPTNSIASVRSGSFAKYLQFYEWRPVILTADASSEFPQTLPIPVNNLEVVRTQYSTISQYLTNKLSGRKLAMDSACINQDNTRSSKICAIYKGIQLLKFLYTRPEASLIIDEPWGWYRNAVKAGLQILKKERIDAIYSSIPPMVSHLIASKLHKESGIPWIAEYRDPWSLYQYYKICKPFSFIQKTFEKRVVDGAECLVTISEPLAKGLKCMFSKDIFIVTNGFDDEDYKENVPLTSKFTITFTGFIYPGIRDPTTYFEVLKQLLEEKQISTSDFEMRFYGGNCNIILPLIKKYSLESIVNLYGLVPYKESIIKQKESTVLLLLTWNDPRELVISGKLFEYFGAGRPILASAFKSGAMAELIRQSGCGVVLNEKKEIKRMLEIWISEWKKHGQINRFFKPNDAVIQSYTRRMQAKRLADILTEVTKK